MPDADLLLSHAGFLRNVARGLLLDDQQADDVVQQTLIAAMEKPPAHAGNLKAWLASVTRNLALMRRRGEGRRRRREESVARPERDLVPTPDEVHARLEMQRRVVDAVMELREPYKSAVVFRYLDELRPEEIADRLGVPVGTVKSRTKRGLALLRDRFDKEVEGGRAAWRLALLPLAVPMATAQAATATTTAAALTTTGLVSMKTIASLAAVLVLAVALLLQQTYSNGGESVRRTDGAASPEASLTPDQVGASEIKPKDGLDPKPVAARTIPLRAIVHDEGGTPLAGVRVESTNGEEEATTDESGRFELLVERIGTTITVGNDTHGYGMVTLSKAGYVRKAVPVFTAASRPTEQVFVLQKGAPLSVRVVDGAGTGVEGAAVEATTADVTVFFDYGMMTSRYTLGKGATDAAGRANLGGAPVGNVRITVTHESWAEKTVTRRIGGLDATEQEIVLTTGGVIEGRITGPDGEPVKNALVQLDQGGGRTAKSGADGRYRIDRVGPGEHTVWASADGFGSGFFGHALGWGEPAGVRVHEGVAARDIDIPLLAPTYVRGRLIDPDGKPVVSATVRVFASDWDRNFTRDGESDAQGRFEVGPLPIDRPRQLSVAVLADGIRFSETTMPVQGAGDNQELGDITGYRVRRILGTTKPGAKVKAVTRQYGASGHAETYADRDGKFAIAAGPGETFLQASHGANGHTSLSEEISVSVPVGGEVTDVELPLRAVGSISGRVVNTAGHGQTFRKLAAVPEDAEAPYVKMRVAWTDRTGAFRFDSLPMGKWRVGLVDRHHYNPSTFLPEPEPRLIEAGRKGVEITMPGEKTIIRGRVLSGRDGTPVRQYTVRFHRFKFFVPQDWLWASYDDESGNFVFDRATPGTWAAEIEADGFAPLRSKTFSLGRNGEIDLGELRLGEPGRVRGQIKDAAGAPVTYARVHLLNSKLQSNDDSIPFTDADGRFEIGGLAPGIHTMFVVSPRHPLGIKKNIVVKEGEATDTELSLDPASPLTIKVVGEDGQPVEGAQLVYSFAALQPLNSAMVAQYEPPGFGSNRSDMDGEIRKPFMPAGALTVQISKQGYAPIAKTVQLVAGEAARMSVRLLKK
ncbi:MAG: sigma-70 family RNA polymerase sigma factor [Planctomycetota bacterium]